MSFSYDGNQRVLGGENWSFSSPLWPNRGYVHSYDFADNPTTIRGKDQPLNDANDQLTGGPAYDADGNPNQDKIGSLGYDIQDELVSRNADYVNADGNTVTATALYGYNLSGQRVYKQLSDDHFGPAERYYIWDGDELLAEVNSSGQIAILNVWGAAGLNSRVYASDSDTGFGPDVIGYAFDPYGNTSERVSYINLTNSEETATDHEIYDAYGKLMYYSKAGFGYLPVPDITQDPYGYKGQDGYYSDQEGQQLSLTQANAQTPNQGGLIYCENRFYSPVQGRWITRDPAGLEGGLNVYEYCGDNPVMNVDPSGLQGRPKHERVRIKVISYRVFGPGWHRGIVVEGPRQSYSFAGGPRYGGSSHNGPLVSKSGIWEPDTQDYDQWHYQGTQFWDLSETSPKGPRPEDERECITLIDDSTHNYDYWVSLFQGIEAGIASHPGQDYGPLPSDFHLWGGNTKNSNTWCHYDLVTAKLMQQFNHAISKLMNRGGDMAYAPGWNISPPWNDAPRP